MRRLRSALLLPLLGLALAAPGCGSDDTDVEEVPGAPPALAVPHQRGADDLAEETGDATPTPTPDADGDGEATQDPAAAGTGTTGGTDTTEPAPAAEATPAPATEDSPETDQAPPAGSAPEQFEQFCEENPGAC